MGEEKLSQQVAERLGKLIAGQVFWDAETLAEASWDFGRMFEKQPLVVVKPARTEDVAETVRFASAEGFSVATRGAAHSQSGQSLSDGGILLDMRGLGGVRAVKIEEMWAYCQSGALWRDLVSALAGTNLIPPVLTNNLNATIGGTLSTGGLGVASFRYATQADNCLELEVVTGRGEMVRCSADQESELFFATLAGLGQFGVITGARLALRRHLPLVRTYYLLYDRLEPLLNDLVRLMSDERISYIESWCSPCPQGLKGQLSSRRPFAAWFYPLHITVEFDPAAPPDDLELLRGLSCYRHLHTEDLPHMEFAFRLEPLFELWRRSGYWQNAHPWMETMLPWETAADYISRTLENFPPHAIGGGHILLWPARGRISKLPFFMTPNSSHIMGFGILPGLPRELLPQIVPLLNLASDTSMAAGGKRYLSGLVQFDREKWRRHFGDKWPELARLKRKYDPKGILNPGFVDFSETP